MSQAYALFNTPIGTCGIVWGERGINGFSLPDIDEDAIRVRLQSRFTGHQEKRPTSEVQKAISDVQALLSGEPKDLLDVRVDLEGVPDFHRRVYDVARSIPPGQTLTYGQIAQKLKAPGTARAVGQALGANPIPIIIPCHRILGSNGSAGGFSAPGGIDTKMKILNIERRHAPIDQSLFPDLPLAPPPRRTRLRRRIS